MTCDLSEIVHSANFEALLASMEDSIHYHETPPDLATVLCIYRAASCLEFASYQAFAVSALNNFYPDTALNIPKFNAKAPVYSHAIDVMRLGRENISQLAGVLKRTFYELARAPGDLLRFCGQGTTAASFNDICRLGTVKQHLAYAWLTLATTAHWKATNCSGGDSCRINKFQSHLRKNYVLQCGNDPLYGIEKLLSEADSLEACAECLAAWRASLEDRRNGIWEDLADWIDMPETDTESESESSSPAARPNSP
ncbi:hypothetical protein HGRIS_004368 [Hohenbuehelia grisea]|uniref:Uncharacterized protein n=1 Tax=Hohenbuehelia grisea TaxID=104357 RepID=A0ABR3JBY4_9AGAR